MLAVRLFKQDPQHAKDWVNQLPSVEARRTANSFIAMEAASVDPKGASEWAATLPDNVRDKAIGGAITAWATKDPEGAGQWVNNLSGTIRDEAILAYSASVSAKDPSAGLTWAASITDPKIRESSLQRIVGTPQPGFKAAVYPTLKKRVYLLCFEADRLLLGADSRGRFACGAVLRAVLL